MSTKKNEYTAAIIIIGDEILSGRTIDENTSWLANKLNQQGIILAETRIIRDMKDDIINTVNTLRKKYDYIFTTGGIGPTHDDITTDSIACAFGVELEENDKARRMLENYYNTTDLNNARLKMAKIPKYAELIKNNISGAPGFRIENVFVMAGVPRIMREMVNQFIYELESGDPTLSNTVTCDLSESKIAESLNHLQEKYSNVSIGSYPQYRGGTLGLSISLSSTDINALKNSTNDVIQAIATLGGQAKAVNVRAERNKDKEESKAYLVSDKIYKPSE